MYINVHKRSLISEIVKIGLSKPFHEIKLLAITSKTFQMYVNDIHRHGGIYVIYATKDNKDECLYVGQTDVYVRQRLYRFFKEMAGCSHPEEDHAGARRAKEGGYFIDSHQYKVKYISWAEIYDISSQLHLHVDYNNLDECIALYLKSRYNTSSYPMYGYNGTTLEGFLEAL
jgi:hypothetical protein